MDKAARVAAVAQQGPALRGDTPVRQAPARGASLAPIEADDIDDVEIPIEAYDQAAVDLVVVEQAKALEYFAGQPLVDALQQLREEVKDLTKILLTMQSTDGMDTVAGRLGGVAAAVATAAAKANASTSAESETL
jgi:hypothetical protein